VKGGEGLPASLGEATMKRTNLTSYLAAVNSRACT
jgi:hypothetical protein